MELSVFLPALTKSVISLFIIVDPLGNVPIFISLTHGMGVSERRKVFRTAAVTGFILLLAFAIAGNTILDIFGVGLPSFMIAGGILLLILAIKILVIGWEREEKMSPESIGAVPMAVPLLVGPGAITTTILSLQEYGVLVTVSSVVIVFTLTWLILRHIELLYKILGKNGSAIIARVMALLIAAIAIQYITNGLRVFFT
ncbi:MAG: MarC family protein [Candidatus Bathyarchaeia archaeon]|nr:MarC family protein [Candidatus Bathyarchaeota archaeon]